MRWSSLVTISTVLAVTAIFEGVFAAPLDVGILEKRVELAVSPDDLKSSSYRTAALKGLNFDGNADDGVVNKVASPAAPPKGKDAGRRHDRPSVSRYDDNTFRPYPRGSDGRQGVGEDVSRLCDLLYSINSDSAGSVETLMRTLLRRLKVS